MSILSIMTEASDRYNLGWNEQSMFQMMEEFLEDQQLEADFKLFIDNKAEEEDEICNDHQGQDEEEDY